MCVFKDTITGEFIQVVPNQILDVWVFTQFLHFTLVLKDTEEIRLFHNYYTGDTQHFLNNSTRTIIMIMIAENKTT